MKHSVPRPLLLAALGLTLHATASASLRDSLIETPIDTTTLAMDRYNPEIGYFQKAYSNLGDPRFMYGSGNFAIGIGGTIRASAYYDLYGSPSKDNPQFNLVDIAIPTDNANKFGISAANTEFHIKARSKFKKHNILAFLQVNANDEEFIKLNQAYVSIDGLTIGKVYSFFMDLEAGTRTVDLAGPCTQISRTHPLVGYKHSFGSHWTAGLALEKPQVNATDFTEQGIQLDNQSMPDVTLQGKYKWSKGHIQLAAVLRNMSYWKHEKGPVKADEGETRHVGGWGISLSGRFAPSSRGHISFQSYYGRGIGHYINKVDAVNLDLGAADYDAVADRYNSMKAVPVYGGFIAGRYRWSRRLASNAVIGYVYASHRDGVVVQDQFKCATYGAVNLFYFVSDYCSVGLEYAGGGRSNYHAPGEKHYGRGNRLNAAFIYMF